MATMVDLQRAIYGRRPCPAGDIWLSDSDVIIVPKARIHGCQEFLDRVFTRRTYGPFALASPINLRGLSTL